MWNQKFTVFHYTIGNSALCCRIHGEEAFLNTACRVSVWVAVALVQSSLKDATVPAIEKIYGKVRSEQRFISASNLPTRMKTIARRVAIRKTRRGMRRVRYKEESRSHERLFRSRSQMPHVIESL